MGKDWHIVCVIMFGYGKGPAHCNAHILTKKNIKVGFKVIGIWPFNPKAMDNKIQPSKFYTTININNHGSNKEEYTLNEEIDHNQSQQWKEEFATVKLLLKLKHQSIKQHLNIILQQVKI